MRRKRKWRGKNVTLGDQRERENLKKKRENRYRKIVRHRQINRKIVAYTDRVDTETNKQINTDIERSDIKINEGDNVISRP